MNGEELDLAPPVKSLNTFIEAELQRLEASPPASDPRGESIESLNALFRELVHETWREAAV